MEFVNIIFRFLFLFSLLQILILYGNSSMLRFWNVGSVWNVSGVLGQLYKRILSILKGIGIVVDTRTIVYMTTSGRAIKTCPSFTIVSMLWYKQASTI